MNEEIFISEVKIEKLAQQVAQTLKLTKDEAFEVIYEEWDLVENLFNTYHSINDEHHHFCAEINAMYWIA